MPFRCGSCQRSDGRRPDLMPSSDKTPSDDHIEVPDGPLTGEDVRARVVRLAFDGDEARYAEFIRALRESIPPDVSVVLRGSAVTGKRWEDGAPFDADGPGTSDLDLTLVGGDMVKHFEVFYIPGLHSAPLSDAHPDASVVFVPLRRALSTIARRPVNIQATSDFAQYLRDRVMTQPYFVMIAKEESDRDAGTGEAR
jgi:predicted nucleotidyltransferase